MFPPHLRLLAEEDSAPVASASHPSLALLAGTVQHSNKIHDLAPTVGPPAERTGVGQDSFLEGQEMEPILSGPSMEDDLRSSTDQRNPDDEGGDDENADENRYVVPSHISPVPSLMSVERFA